jgi:uncharacterized membrane protein
MSNTANTSSHTPEEQDSTTMEVSKEENNTPESTRKNSWITEVVLVFIIALPLLYLWWQFDALPEKTPLHFGPDGTPDRYGDKSTFASMIAIFTGFQLVTFILLKYIPALELTKNKEKVNSPQNQFAQSRIRVLVHSLMAVIGIVIVNSAIEEQVAIFVIEIGILLLVSGIGNYMTNIKQNHFIGIRTSRTLNDEEVWKKTHRFGGRFMFWGGLAGILPVLVIPAPYSLFVVIAWVLGLCIVPIRYSQKI